MIELTSEQFNNLLEKFKTLGKDAFFMSHYDLSEKTGDPAHIWKTFLTDPKVNDYIQEELNLIRNAELNKLLQNIGTSNSIGKAQLIQALTKINDNKDQKKEGPAFIYCYIPLNEEQQYAKNVMKIDKDPFLK